MLVRWALLTLLVTLTAGASSPAGAGPSDGVIPLARAHAHNDYVHTRPLLDALEHGFTSIEADYIDTDDLAGLRAFLLRHDPAPSVPQR